ncbi:MAG: hypothetical protein WAM71_16925 [Candidatus Korobacteraceae bacterium]
MDTKFRDLHLHLDFASRTTAGLALLLLLLFSFNAWCQTSTPAASSDTPKQEFYSPQDRQLAIKQASIFKAENVGEANIMAGPKQSKDLFQFHFKDKVTCEFVEPGSKMGGNTPKFLCKIMKVESADGTVQTLTPDMKEEPVKVKFGSDNREVYAEIASSRLLWALGFYTDAWFPIQVTCTNCPSDPEKGSGAVGLQSYPQASVVRKFDGHKMYEMGNEEEGWSWKELETLNGRPSYEKDGLRLMGAFIDHSDNKPPQQRLVCHGVNMDTSAKPYKTTCKESDMVVQDVGATFGGGGLFTSNTTAKANLHDWSNKPVWNKGGVRADKLSAKQQPPECQAKLTKSLTAKDGLENPTISEEGRRFTAGLLCQLSDQQIASLFKAARFAEMPENHGKSEDAVVQAWVTAFKQKREDVAGARCRWHNQPADLSVIDNPAGLPTVTNYCTASPH